MAKTAEYCPGKLDVSPASATEFLYDAKQVTAQRRVFKPESLLRIFFPTI